MPVHVALVNRKGRTVCLHPEVEAWYLDVCKSDPETGDLIEDAIDQLTAESPALGGGPGG